MKEDESELESAMLKAAVTKAHDELDNTGLIPRRDVSHRGLSYRIRQLVRNNRPLTAAMDNLLASRLGKVALQAGDPRRGDIGDSIDRGLILRRLLEENGFAVIKISE